MYKNISDDHFIAQLGEALRSLMNSGDTWLGLNESLDIIRKLTDSGILTLLEVEQIDAQEVTLMAHLVLVTRGEKCTLLPLDIRQTHNRGKAEHGWFEQLAKGKKVGGLISELDPHWYDFLALHELNFQSFLLFPVFVDHRLWGIVGIGNADPHKLWSSAEKIAIETYSALLANQIMRRAAQQALISSRDALAANELRYRSFVELSMEGIYYVNMIPPMPLDLPIEEQAQWFYDNAVFHSCNPTFCRMYNYNSPSELEGKPARIIYEHDPTGDMTRAIEYFIQSQYQLTPSVETREYNTAGEEVWYLNSGVGIIDNGYLVGVWGIQQDITIRKKAEIALRESELKLTEVMAGTQIGVWEWRKTHPGFFTIDHNIVKILELPEGHQTLSQHDFWQRLHPKAAVELKQITRKHVKGRSPFYEMDLQVMTDKGQWRWVHLRGVIIEKTERNEANRIIGTMLEEDEKKNREQERLENEALFRTFFDYSPLGVYYIDTNQCFFYVNQRFCDLIGYRAEELLGRDVWSVAHNGDYESIVSQIKAAYERKQTELHFEKRYEHKNGRIIWTSITLTLIWDESGQYKHAIGLVDDITEQRLYKETLQINEARLKATLSAMPDIKFHVNETGHVIDLYASPAELDIIGLTYDDIIHHDLASWMPIFIAHGFLHNIKKALQIPGEVQRFEFIWPSETASQFYEARINAIDSGELIIVLRNLTAWKRAEQEVQEKLTELDIQNRKLQAYIDSNLQLENFAYIASHDLREPVRTIRTFAQILERRYGEAFDEAGRTYLDFITKGASQMNNLIEDLLTYSRVNTDETTLEPIDTQALLSDIAHMLANYIAEKDARIEHANLPPSILGSYTKLHQLFMNLIVNAIKFGPLDTAPVVSISCKDKGDCWEFAVKDNGIGIAPEFHEQIFMLFKKLHTRQEYHGTGIGLALCKKIVEQHGGTIHVISTQGEGSTFVFTLKKEGAAS